MPNHLKFCGCPRCRSGMHTKSGGKMVKRVVRRSRRTAKVKLKKGEEPEPKSSVDYTD
jgi:hypothetical protein